GEVSREERERLAAERTARERARREHEAAIAYQRRMEALALRQEAAWQQVHANVETRKPAEYDEAARLLKDLQAVAMRQGCTDAFDQGLQQLRAEHVKKVSLLQRLDRLGL